MNYLNYELPELLNYELLNCELLNYELLNYLNS
jgi:hypothetical protein